VVGLDIVHSKWLAQVERLAGELRRGEALGGDEIDRIDFGWRRLARKVETAVAAPRRSGSGHVSQ
jgi:hypothetical protein